MTIKNKDFELIQNIQEAMQLWEVSEKRPSKTVSENGKNVGMNVLETNEL